MEPRGVSMCERSGRKVRQLRALAAESRAAMSRHVRPRIARALGIALLGVLPLNAFAQELDAGAAPAPDEAGPESLLSEPVVSAASRTAESSSDAPGTTWTI